jgi:hypothetical protein
LASAQELVLSLVNTQPVAGTHVSSVHGLASKQTIGVPPQVPPVHTSLLVQALWSLHVVPLVTGAFVQTPVPVSQLSVVH